MYRRMSMIIVQCTKIEVKVKPGSR